MKAQHAAAFIFILLVQLSNGDRCFAAGPTASGAPSSASGSTVVPAALSAGHPDNSGRKIAVLSPHPTATHAPPRVRAVHRPGLSATSTAGWRKVTIKIPPTVDEAADFCVQTGNRMGKVATDKAREVSNWLGVFAKQMNSAPTVTPAGSPYETQAPLKFGPVRFNNKPWFMPDGRLKTLVQR